MEFIIRPFDSVDIPRLIEIIRLNTPPYFSLEEEELYLNFLKNDIEEYYIVEVDGQIIGAGGINSYKEPFEIVFSWGMFDPEWQGKGYGTHLLEFRLQRIKERFDVKSVICRTSQHTYLFYHKNGFVLNRSVKDHWAKGIDLYEMEYHF